MSSFTTSKHFIFPRFYLLHVLLHHIQTLHLLLLLPPACPPSPHPNTSSSLASTSCMSSFTTSKHVIFSRSYLLHVLLHHIQTLHLSSLLPPACPPSPHPNTSSLVFPVFFILATASYLELYRSCTVAISDFQIRQKLPRQVVTWVSVWKTQSKYHMRDSYLMLLCNYSLYIHRASNAKCI